MVNNFELYTLQKENFRASIGIANVPLKKSKSSAFLYAKLLFHSRIAFDYRGGFILDYRGAFGLPCRKTLLLICD